MTSIEPGDARTDESEPARLIKRVARERAARKEAERLLDEQSRALYDSNRKLEEAFVELKINSDQTRALLEHMPNGVIITAPDGTVESVNFLARQIFGTTPAIAKGRSITYFLPNITALDSELLAQASDPFNPVRMSARNSGGTEFPCEVVATRLAGSSEARTIWVVRDITRRVEADKQREKLENELRQAHKLESLGTMAGGIAHELNTPIQFVTDNTNFLAIAFDELLAAINELKDNVSPESFRQIEEAHDLVYLAQEVPQAVAQSREGLGRIAEIVLAIKRFSHPSGSNKENNDLNQIIQTTAMVSKNQWKYVADLDLQLAPNLTPIRSNAGELNQAFLNLIVNAAHAIEDDTSKPKPGKITISTRELPGAIECRISDTGVGIKPENRARLFDLFFTTKAPGRGTGQGLAVVHTVVTQSHGGKIEVESTPGIGTTFIITLPVDGIGAPGTTRI